MTSKNPGPTRLIIMPFAAAPSTETVVFDTQPLTSEFSMSVAERMPATLCTRSRTC